MAVITIFGAGMMGTAMCWPARDNGHTVRLVGTPLDDAIIASIRETGLHPTLQRALPPGVQVFSAGELPAAITGADLVIGGVSSFGVEWLARAAGPYLRPEVPVLSVTKGLEDHPDGSLEILPAVLNRLLPAHLRGQVSLNAVGGPCIAHELAARRHTAVVFTGPDPAVLAHLREMLATPYYHVWTSTDMIGVEACAALKNAYAMGVGMAVGMMEAAGPDGLARGYNPQAALFAQSIHEMRRLVMIMGGGEVQSAWLPGPGDLYVTVFGGRTVRLGRLLGQGVPFSEAREILAGVTLESVAITTRVARALPRLAARGLLDLSSFPLILHLNQVINHASPVSIPWERFFADIPGG